MLQLPRLETAIDCGPLGYPGLRVVFWLNPPIQEDTPPGTATEPGDGSYYRELGRVLVRVEVPAAFTDSGGDEVIELGSGRAVRELEHRKDFDPQVLQWAIRRYSEERQERLRAEVKN